jgi:hypothetical protein
LLILFNRFIFILVSLTAWAGISGSRRAMFGMAGTKPRPPGCLPVDIDPCLGVRAGNGNVPGGCGDNGSFATFGRAKGLTQVHLDRQNVSGNLHINIFHSVSLPFRFVELILLQGDTACKQYIQPEKGRK